MSHCSPTLLLLPRTSARLVCLILDFMYTGEASLCHEQLADFLKLAEVFRVEGLASQQQRDHVAPPTDDVATPPDDQFEVKQEPDEVKQEQEVITVDDGPEESLPPLQQFKQEPEYQYEQPGIAITVLHYLLCFIV